jgi:hypothetical protein
VASDQPGSGKSHKQPVRMPDFRVGHWFPTFPNPALVGIRLKVGFSSTAFEVMHLGSVQGVVRKE